MFFMYININIMHLPVLCCERRCIHDAQNEDHPASVNPFAAIDTLLADVNGEKVSLRRRPIQLDARKFCTAIAMSVANTRSV